MLQEIMKYGPIMSKEFPNQPHINDSSKPLILIGSNSNLYKFFESCEDHKIAIKGIIDSDYYNNTKDLDGIPIIDTELAFETQEKLHYYRNNYNFMCVTRWIPEEHPIHIRNKEKRKRLLALIKKLDLPMISVIDKSASVSRYATIGKDVYIEPLSHVSPHAIIEDHCYVGACTGISHHVHMKENCVVQGDCKVLTSTIEKNTFFSTGVKALKPGVTYGEGTFIHEMVYIRRGTTPGEVVSFGGENPKRVFKVAEF